MKIRRVTLEVREAVLSNTGTGTGTDVVESKTSVNKGVKINIEESASKIDFNSLSVEDQIAEIRKSGARKAVNLFKQAKRPNDMVIQELLKKNPKAIDHIKAPKAHHINLVLEKHPKALNRLAPGKRTEELIIRAIRPVKSVLTGPRDIRAKHTLQNILALEPNTTFTPRVHHEIVRLMHGAIPRDLKRLDTVFKKQGRKMPDELLRMIKQLGARKSNITLKKAK